MFTADQANDLATNITDAVFEMLTELHEVMEFPESAGEDAAYESVRRGLQEIRKVAEALAAQNDHQLRPLEGQHGDGCTRGSACAGNSRQEDRPAAAARARVVSEDAGGHAVRGYDLCVGAHHGRRSV